MKTSSSIPKTCTNQMPRTPPGRPPGGTCPPRPHLRTPVLGNLATCSNQLLQGSKAQKGPQLKSQLATCGCPGKYVTIPITTRNSQLLPYLPGQPQYEDCRNSLVIAYRARQFCLKKPPCHHCMQYPYRFCIPSFQKGEDFAKLQKLEAEEEVGGELAQLLGPPWTKLALVVINHFPLSGALVAPLFYPKTKALAAFLSLVKLSMPLRHSLSARQAKLSQSMPLRHNPCPCGIVNSF